MSLYLTVPLVAVTYWAVLVTSLHPCGFLLGIFDLVTRGLNFHETYWEVFPPHAKYCLARGASWAYFPKQWSSYYHGARALLFAEWSRDRAAPQASQSYQFERDAAQFLGVKHMYYVSTGTAALEVMYMALGIGPGDEVIVPSATWIATASAVNACGAIPVLAEIDESLGINPRTLENYITPRTKAIMAVHLRGNPCNITGIRDVAERKGVVLLEDIAQSFGASINGKKVGTYGLAGMTSVGPSKPYNAGGQGGLVWTSDDDLGERMQWAIENRVALAGGPESPGPAGGGGGAGKQRVPFAGHGFRAPSE